MTEDLERALAWCLDALEGRRLTMEECLQRYPQHKAELQVLLPLAMAIRHAPDVQPSPEFRLHARQRLISKLKPRPLRAGVSLKHLVSTMGVKPKKRSLWRPAFASLILFLVAFAGVGVVYAADASKPGDALYGLDTAVESARLALTFSQERRARMALGFASERIAEMEDLAAEGGSEEDIQQAVIGYSEMVRTAAEAVSALAASGDMEEVVALGALLRSTLSMHGHVLGAIRDQVPEAVGSAIDRAKNVSERGGATVEALLADEMPDDKKGGVPGSTPEPTPSASPDHEPGPGPTGTPVQPPDETSTGLPKATSPGPPDHTPGPNPSGPPTKDR